jgi:transcriptional regulator with XRE-family HTH domain
VAAAPLYDFATLKRWRNEAGLTRERVCADLEISYPWLARLEAGNQDRAPSLALLNRLAIYYGHGLHELVTPERAAS